MKKKNRKLRRVIIIVLAAVLVGTVFLLTRNSGNSVAVVSAAVAQRGSLQESIKTTGTVSAEETRVFFAPVSGRLADVRVQEGDAVKAGDILITYDEEELESALAQAALQQEKSTAYYNGAYADNTKHQAKLTEANTNIPVLEQQIADYENAVNNLQKQLDDSRRGTSNALAKESYELNNKVSGLQEELQSLDPASDAELYAAKQKELKDVQTAISQNAYLQQTANYTDYLADLERQIADFQEKIANCKEYKAQMESQKSGSESAIMDTYARQQYNVDKNLAEITYAEAEKSYETGKAGITAGFDGVVTEVPAEKGSTVSEGMRLLTLESLEKVKVTFNASKIDVEKLALGQEAEIVISGCTYKGKVSKISHMAVTNASNTPMVGVEVSIDNPDDKIILGLDAKLEVFTRSEEDALLIPVEVVNADKDGDFVYVAEDGKAVRKPIVCGISNDTYTVVLEGITEEDMLITELQSGLEEGMAVAVLPAQ